VPIPPHLKAERPRIGENSDEFTKRIQAQYNLPWPEALRVQRHVIMVQHLNNARTFEELKSVISYIMESL
jgi:hypothetical protein